MSLRMRSAAVGLAAVAVLGGSAVAAQPVGAATKGTCGSGYRYKDRYPINKNSTMKKVVAKVGYVSLYYNRKTGKNCAITRPLPKLAGPHHGVQYIGVYLQDTEDGSHASQGSSTYRRYAGPVYTKAVGHCVTVTGTIKINGHIRRGGGFVVHCG